jgi:signal peptidase I
MARTTARLTDVERVDPPDLWREILEREPMRGGLARPARVVRVLAVAAIVLLAVPLGLFASGHSVSLAGFTIGGSDEPRLLVTEPSASMLPTIKVGQQVTVATEAYRNAPPARGDVIAFSDPAFPNDIFFKRVIGLPGDVVDERKGVIFINGVELDEPYVIEDHRTLGPWTVSANHVFVLGDNRPDSNDSRYAAFGQLSFSHIVGKVLLGDDHPDGYPVPVPTAPVVSVPRSNG